ncbi:MAG: zinc ABC transporter substrate-binding protein [Acetobacter indonesiensis]
MGAETGVSLYLMRLAMSCVSGLMVSCLTVVSSYAQTVAPPTTPHTTLTAVAAENTWGDLAAQVAEPDIHVTSILTTPTIDPHLYEPSPAEARRVHDATLLVANGAGYDAWMEHLASARSTPAPMVRADSWGGWHKGDNTHLWYNLAAVAAFVGHFTALCQQVDPAHTAGYTARSQTLLAAIDAVRAHIAALRPKIEGQPVAATEPVFTPLADSLGLVMKERAFQQAIMNDVEPPASAVAAFDDDIRQRRVRLVAYNAQADRPSVQRLIASAKQVGIPVLPVLEIMPVGEHWQTWVDQTVTNVADALGVTP